MGHYSQIAFDFKDWIAAADPRFALLTETTLARDSGDILAPHH